MRATAACCGMSGFQTMKVLVEDASPANAGLVYTCSIRQATGFAVEFEIKSGETVGRPAGPYIHSGARIELLDGVNGAVVTNLAVNLANATHVRQYRQSGGIMVFVRSTGEPAQYTTRTGRIHSDPASEVVLYESGGDLTQVRTAAGLLVLAEVTSRKYTIERYLPSQVSGGSAPYTTAGDPVLTVTVEHPATTASLAVTREINGRTTLNEWVYSVVANGNQWLLTRKVWNVSAWETAWTKKRFVGTTTGTVKRIIRTWSKANGTAFYTGDITVAAQDWGALGATLGSATDGDRSVAYHTNPASPGSYGKLSNRTDRAGLPEDYEYDANGRMTLRKSEWLDSVASRHEVFGYTAHVGGETLALNDYRPRTTAVNVDGGTKTISKTMFAAYEDGAATSIPRSRRPRPLRARPGRTRRILPPPAPTIPPPPVRKWRGGG